MNKKLFQRNLSVVSIIFMTVSTAVFADDAEVLFPEADNHPSAQNAVETEQPNVHPLDLEFQRLSVRRFIFSNNIKLSEFVPYEMKMQLAKCKI
jgi:hypothetical protein